MGEGDILALLAEGDRKEIARSGEAAAAAAECPRTLAVLVAALFHNNKTIVSHAAHALMTLAENHLTLLDPHREGLARAYGLEQWEVKEQLAKILPRLPFTPGEQGRLVEEFDETLKGHKSAIARACALEAMVQMARTDARFLPTAREALGYAGNAESKALQARARKLAPLV